MKRALLPLALLLVAGCATPQGEPLAEGREPDAPAPRDEGWPDPAAAQVRPGIAIHTAKRDCASNFLFVKPDNSSIFLGSTANCFRDMAVGELVTIGGPENIGMLVYSSWQTMAEIDEADPVVREYNDFAVVRFDSSVKGRISPALLHRGGPTSTADAASAQVGDRVLAHVNASHLESTPWRPGVVTGKVGDWALLVHAPLPPLPGTMGGAVVDEQGRALGVAVSLGVIPNPGAVSVARLDALLDYARDNAYLDMQLATAELRAE